MFDLLLHYDWVTCVKFSPEALNILSSYSDGSIKLIQNQQRERSWKIYRRRFAVCFQQDGDEYIPLIVCYDQVESKLEICQGLNGDVIRSLSTIPNHKPRSWDISPDGTMIVIGYDRGIIQLLATTDKELWKIEEAHSDKVLHCYFSPDGSRIVSCGGDKDCTHKVWSVAEGKMLSWQPDCQDYWIKPCVFYNDSRRLASTALGSVLVWDTDTGEKLFICEGISNHLDESILCVNISGDYKRLIASASNGRIAVWDADNGKPLFNGSYTSPNGNSQARFCSLNWDGSVAAVGHDDSVLKIYNVESGHERVCPSTGLTAAWMIATQFSPDNRQILTLSDSIQVTIANTCLNHSCMLSM
jgi:WD40 repeat protein